MAELPEKFTCCQCEDPDFDEGVCLQCHRVSREDWGLNSVQEKINDIIDYLRQEKHKQELKEDPDDWQ